MENLTSEKLPEAVPILTKEVSELKRLLIKKMVQVEIVIIGFTGIKFIAKRTDCTKVLRLLQG